MPDIGANNRVELQLLLNRMTVRAESDRATKAIADGQARAELRRRIEEYLLIPKALRFAYDDPREELKAKAAPAPPVATSGTGKGRVRIVKGGGSRG